MLAGLSSPSASMFPNLMAAAPTPADMQAGQDMLTYNRAVVLDGYHTRVFDMHSQKDAKAYEKLMRELSTGVQARKSRIVVHERRIMQRKDGSAGWFNYLEWMEFRLDESPATFSNVK